jgi:hypothetical protein
MKFNKLMLALLIPALFTGCLDWWDNGSRYGYVSGYVMDENGTALEGASIEIDYWELGTTDQYGYFEIEFEYYTFYDLRISKPGYGEFLQSFYPEDEPPFEYYLNSSNQGNLVSYEGYVRNSSGSAINNAYININGVTSYSSSTGYYYLEVETIGSATVYISKSGYQAYSSIIYPSGSYHSQNFTLADTPAYYTTNFYGTISSSSGGVIQGATVNINGSATATNSSGYFSLPYTHDGNVTVMISAPGHSPYSTTLTGITATSYSLSQTLNADVVSYTTTVSGYVRDSSTNLGIGYATVQIGTNQVTASSTGYYSTTVTHNGTIPVAAGALGFYPSSSTITTTSSSRSYTFYLVQQ